MPDPTTPERTPLDDNAACTLLLDELEDVDEYSDDEPVWGDEPVCWAEHTPGNRLRCGLSVDHNGEHYFNTWEGRAVTTPPDDTTEAELGRLRNRITALEANGSELLARGEKLAAQLADDVKRAEAEAAEAKRVRDNYATAYEARQRDYRKVADQLYASCICDPNPETTEGMLEDCPVHGAEEHRPLALRAERDRLKSGGKELGKIVDFLGDLIKAAYLRGADDPIDAVHMLGNCLAELLEGEGGLPADEHNRVYRALEDQRAKQDTLRAPESTADAPSPVTAATEAHGEAGETQRGSDG